MSPGDEDEDMDKRFSQLHEKYVHKKQKWGENLWGEKWIGWVGLKIDIASKKWQPTKNAEFNRSKSRCLKLETK